MPIQKIWKIRSPNPQLQVKLSDALGVHPVIAQLLINRGVTDSSQAKIFLSSNIADLHDPFLLKDMDKAVARIKLAQQNREKVLVHGDYDVDGVTSTAILHKALTKLGLEVINYIPHRVHDGYGLNENVVTVAQTKKVSLLIAVDCGVTANRQVELLNKAGIDVIVIDHHEPSEEGIPAAVAVVDPKRKDCSYPFKHLAAVGLVAKLTHALFGEMQVEDLDLVALGTIADVVQLTGENRIIVKAGLPRISATTNKGLSALMEVARIKDKKMRPYHAGFILGPRLNATGRMDSAQKSLDLLLSETDGEAEELAQFLETTNGERQRLQREIIEDAISLVEREVNFRDHKVIVLSKAGWHKGVLGIVASRLAETYYRPAIVISLQDGVGTASARSIEGFHLHEALASCAPMLENFGGHKLAAGLTIREENVDRFRAAINDFAQDILEVRDLMPSLDIDLEVPLSGVSLDLVSLIDDLEPYGEGNPEPVFCSRQLTVKSKPMVMGKETLKFWVTDGNVALSAVGFGMSKYKDLVVMNQKIDLAYQLMVDDWNKAPTLGLKIKDIRSV